MPFKLFGVVVYFIPFWLFGREFMEFVSNERIPIQTVCNDRK